MIKINSIQPFNVFFCKKSIFYLLNEFEELTCYRSHEQNCTLICDCFCQTSDQKIMSVIINNENIQASNFC